MQGLPDGGASTVPVIFAAPALWLCAPARSRLQTCAAALDTVLPDYTAPLPVLRVSWRKKFTRLETYDTHVIPDTEQVVHGTEALLHSPGSDSRGSGQ